MASTYTLNNGIELIGTGEQSGTWGDTTNTNFSLLDTALDGQVTVTLASAGTSGSPNTLPISDGAASDGRNRMVIFSDGGDLGATAYVQLTPNDAEKIIYVRNALSGSRSIILFQGTYNASNDYEIPAGTTAVIYFDGGGSGAVAANVFNNAYFDSLRLGGVSVTAIIDDDTMATASATSLATSESIKAYVDSSVGAQDTLSEILANGNTTGGNDILFADNDKAIFGAGNDVQVYHDATNSYMQNYTGNLYIQNYSDDKQIQIATDNGSGGLAAYFLANGNDGSVILYNYGNAKLTTTNTGVDITGTAVTDGLTVAGNVSVDGGTIKLDGNYPNGTGNVALGDQAGDALASGGNYNVAVGSAALSAVITGDQNVAIGTGALQVSTASSNTAIGYLAGAALTTGDSNVALGVNALNDMVSGSNNTVLGKQAGDALGNEIVATAIVSGVNYTIQTTGTTDFTLIGAADSNPGTTFTATGAGTGTGTASANANYNTFVGHQAGDVVVGGSKNTIIGRFDGNQNTIDIRNSDNNIVLSDGDGNPRLAYVSANAELVINEQSSNVDFRVESDNNANALFVDASTDRIGINTGSPSTPLDVRYGLGTAYTGTAQSAEHINIFNTSTGVVGLTSGIRHQTRALDQTGQAFFTGAVSSSGGYAPSYVFQQQISAAGYREVMAFAQAEAVFNNPGNNYDFRVESDAYSHSLFLDASGSGKVGINTAAPTYTFVVSNQGAEGLEIDPVNQDQQIRLFAYDRVAADYVSLGMFASDHYWSIAGTTRLAMDSTGGITATPAAGGHAIFNEGGVDADFRIESDINANAFFVNGATNKIGIGEQGTSGNWSSSSWVGFGMQGGSTIGSFANAAYPAINLTENGYPNAGSFITGYVRSNTNKATNIMLDRGDVFLRTAGSASAGSAITWTDTLNVYNSSTGAVFNEGGVDRDFRVESDANSNMLFVDAGSSEVGIGTGSPASTLDVAGTTTTKRLLVVDDGSTSPLVNIKADDQAPWAFQIQNDTYYNGDLYGFRGYMENGGAFQWQHKTSNFATVSFKVSNTSTTLSAWEYNGGFGSVFNQDSNADMDFRVESDNNSNMLFVDAGDDRLFVGGATDGNSALNPSVLHVGPVASKNGIKVELNSSANYVAFSGKGGNTDWYYGHMVNPSNSVVGSIVCNNTSTSYNTSSDYRLKENVVELTGATERLKQLKPSRFNFITDPDKTVDGFLAHEVQAVVPEAIHGTKDEVDPEGNPVHQGIDQSKLVPLLVATIKELEARIAALEAK